MAKDFSRLFSNKKKNIGDDEKPDVLNLWETPPQKKLNIPQRTFTELTKQNPFYQPGQVEIGKPQYQQPTGEELKTQTEGDNWKNKFELVKSKYPPFSELYAQPQIDAEYAKKMKQRDALTALGNMLFSFVDTMTTARGGIAPKRDMKGSKGYEDYLKQYNLDKDAWDKMKANYELGMIPQLFEPTWEEKYQHELDLLKQKGENEVAEVNARAENEAEKEGGTVIKTPSGKTVIQKPYMQITIPTATSPQGDSFGLNEGDARDIGNKVVKSKYIKDDDVKVLMANYENAPVDARKNMTAQYFPYYYYIDPFETSDDFGKKAKRKEIDYDEWMSNPSKYEAQLRNETNKILGSNKSAEEKVNELTMLHLKKVPMEDGYSSYMKAVAAVQTYNNINNLKSNTQPTQENGNAGKSNTDLDEYFRQQ